MGQKGFCNALSLAVLLLSFGALPERGDDKPIVLVNYPDGLSSTERQPLVLYLEAKLGSKVRLVTPDSYNDAVAGLTQGSVDFACLGGVTYVRAHAQIGVIPLVQRVTDSQNHSVFIAGAETGIHSLSDVRGRQVAFGDPNSTAGHVMPYLELKRAGLSPGRDYAARFTFSHPLTIKLVETGIVDAGAVDEAVFLAMVKSGQIDGGKVRVFHKTKPFVDWVWVARNDVPASMRNKFIQAFLNLQQENNDDVLKILRATKFVVANDSEYRTLRGAVHELKLY